MNIPKQCVFSGDTELLNTCMTITLDSGEVVQAWVSDAFADSATPSKVKEAVIGLIQRQAGAQKEIDEIIAKAKSLGLEISMPRQVVAPAPAPAPAPVPAPAPTPIMGQIEPSNPNNRIIEGRAADAHQVKANVQGSVSALGSAVSGGGSEYEITSSDKPSQDLKEGEVAEIGTVKGRAGMDVAIPVRRVGKTGETKVSIIDTGGDPGLQKRFKDMAGGEPPDFIHQGYTVKTVECPLCRGSGKSINGRECPKCKGAGSIDVG